MSNKFISLFLKFSFGGIVSAAISFFSTPVITALILPDEFGKASMFVLAFNFLLQIVLLGADQSFARYFYQGRHKDTPGPLLGSVVALPLLLTFVIAGGILFFWQPISNLLINTSNFNFSVLLLITLIVGVIERFTTLLIRMLQDAMLFSNLKIIQVTTNFVVTVLFARYVEKSFLAIVYGNLFSLFCIALTGLIAKRKIWFSLLKIEKETVLNTLKYGLPFVPVFIIAWVFEGMDKMALKYYSNFTQIGIYTAASKIVAVLMLLQTTFSTFWAPVAYEAFEQNSADSKKLFESVFSKLGAVFFICSLLIILTKGLIIHLFSKNYAEAINVVPFLIFMPVMYSLSEITVSGINFFKKTHWHLVISAVSAIVNFAGVIFLVPKFGAMGAAISTAIAYVTFFYARTFISNRYFPLNFALKKTTFSIAVLLLAAFLSVVDNQLVALLSGIVALGVFTFLYYNELVSGYNILKNKAVT